MSCQQIAEKHHADDINAHGLNKANIANISMAHHPTNKDTSDRASAEQH